MIRVYEPLVCRYCRCTEEDACTLGSGETCSWFNRERNVCTNPACVGKYEAEKRRNTAELARLKAARRMTASQVHDAIKRGNRPRKRKKVA